MKMLRLAAAFAPGRCDHPRVNKSEKLDELVGSVEELLARLPEGLLPEIAALRDKVDDGIFEAWKSISGERAQSARCAPRATLTSGAVAGLAILLVLAARFGLGQLRSRRF